MREGRLSRDWGSNLRLRSTSAVYFFGAVRFDRHDVPNINPSFVTLLSSS